MQQLQQWAPGHTYVNPLDQVVTILDADLDTGLSESEVLRKLELEGQNKIERQSDIRPLRILLEQFKSSVVILLLVAAVISAVLSEYLQTVGIVVALFINATVGFLTEYRAKVSLEKLSKLAGSFARVRRDAVEKLIPVADIVRGDLLLLQPGDRVPADCRLVEAPSLSVDESILTGESVPAWKSATASSAWEQSVLFQGTAVATGRAKAVVIGVGKESRLGALAQTTNQIDDTATPLQVSLDELGRMLTWTTLIVCAVVGVVGVLFRGLDLLRMIETCVALAVAAIPEGLPVVATLALAIGIRRMVQKKALVRRLTAVETLGCTTVICTDKTGTLTENKMKVNQAITKAGIATLSGVGYEPTGEVEFNSASSSDGECRSDVEALMRAAALCNDAVLQLKDERWSIVGDPTEGALLAGARKLGLNETDLANQYQRIFELPFDLDRKRMSTIHAISDSESLIFCKGSPEILMPFCSRVMVAGKEQPFTEQDRAWFAERNAELSDGGLRVLAVAQRLLPEYTICMDPANLEQDLILLGLVGMSDSLRPHVEEAIQHCKTAGIRILMLTGDQQRTAKAIGNAIGITDVLSRVTPEMKLNVVRDLRAQGEVVAMTGDGVNDAPALKQSSIGIAMGESGSDLARDAADLVITDDNFATIVAAIEEGRAIYRNIKRAIAYLLTASLASVLVVAIGILVNKELLLTPLQLLWLNLIMHVFPSIGLVLQRDTKDAMFVPPRRHDEPLLTKATIWHIGIRALVISIATSLAPMLAHRDLVGATDSSIFLTVVSLALILQSWSWLYDSAIDKHGGRLTFAMFANRPMLVTTAISLILVLAALYIPGLQVVLQTQPLDSVDWTVSLAVALGTFLCSLVLCRFRTK